jgi:protoporphyrinogen oxidase
MADRKSCSRRAADKGQLRLVYLHVREEPRLDGETFYFPEEMFPFGRVSIPRRFCGAMQANTHATCFACEVPCTEHDEVWKKTDRELFELCSRGLADAELVGKEAGYVEEESFVVSLPRNYPVYSLGWETRLRRALDHLACAYPHLYSSGKFGLFLHYNLDHAIQLGLMLAEHIHGSGTAREWYGHLDVFQAFRTRD